MRWGWACVLGAVVAVACGDDDHLAPPRYCYEYSPGQRVDPHIGGSAASQVIVQAVADVSLAVTAATNEVTAICERIANELGVDQGAIAAALEDRDYYYNTLTTKACAVAKNAIVASGSVKLAAQAPTCSDSATLDALCTRSCVPASTGCSDACTAIVAAKAECLEPNDPRFGRLLVLRARMMLVNEKLTPVSGALSRAVDFKDACVPVVAAALRTTMSDLAHAIQAVDDLVAAAGGT